MDEHKRERLTMSYVDEHGNAFGIVADLPTEELIHGSMEKLDWCYFEPAIVQLKRMAAARDKKGVQ